MTELLDRLPGEIILASFHNEVKNRTMMRYASLAALEASVPLPDVGMLGSLGVPPYILDPSQNVGDGVPVMWMNDEGQTSPFGVGERWTQFIMDSGGQMFGRLEFIGVDPTNPLAEHWAVEAESGHSMRTRLYNADDGLSNVIQMQLAGNSTGTNYIRIPDAGPFELRLRTGSLTPVSVQAGTGVSFPLAKDSDDGQAFYPLVFTNPDEWGPSSGEIGIYAMKTIGEPTLAISRLDASNARALAITGVVSSSSTTWRIGPVNYPSVNGPDLYTFERGSSSSQRWKEEVPTARSAADDFGSLIPRRFKYIDGYLAEEDERNEVDMWGFFAEELETVDPAMVDHDQEGLPSDYDLRQVLAMTVAAVQDVRDRVEALET